jgi:hypothetical protein
MLHSIFRTMLVAAGLGISAYAAAQHNPDNMDKMVDFLPPPPNAAAIAKHSALTLNKNTGVPNINIPLYTLSSKTLSVPVSLSYSSSGIKVDEVASRAGIGWVINIGGVVTRILRGTPDDVNPRKYPWATVAKNWSTFNYLDAIAKSTNVMGYDSEPDLFSISFNGRSVSFVFDENMNPVQLSHSNCKISYNFSSTDWNFKVIDGDGVAYYFGGTDRIEKTKREQICGKLFDTYIATAWYLKKIEHPNGDHIDFNYSAHTYEYDNGRTETMYKLLSPYPSGNQCTSNTACPDFPNKNCINLTKTQGVLLTEVIAPNRASLKFYYQDRQDCSDKLIRKVELVNGFDQSVVSFFKLHYNQVTSSPVYGTAYYAYSSKTPYLESLTENTPDSSLQKTHLFVYHKPTERPARLSYAQDHWGYFNGAVNTTLIPKPDIYLQQQRFPFATANREPDITFTQKGMLSKIVYPTGGMDSIVYEANKVQVSTSVNPKHLLTCQVTGTSFHTQVTKSLAFNAADQYVELNMQCIDNGGADDTLHHKGKVEILQGSTVLFSEILSPGSTITRHVGLSASSALTLKLYANGAPVTMKATLKHYPYYSSTATNKNKVVGGLRVAAVLTQTPEDSPSVKRYYYGALNSLDLSSQVEFNNPRYIKVFETRDICVNSVPGSHFFLIPRYCWQTSIQSNSILNLFDYHSSPVSYSSVVESDGENFENGGTHTTFFTGNDALGVVVWGEDILNSPLSNFSNFLNAKPKEEVILKRSASNSLVTIKKTVNSFKIDPRYDKTVYGYNINKKYEVMFEPDTTCDLNYFPTNQTSCAAGLDMAMESFDVVKYSIMASWVYGDTTWETTYDQNGQNPITNRTIFYYNSDHHLQVTKVEKLDSKGNALKSEFKYPGDYAGTTVYDQMLAKNIVEETIDAKSFVNNSETGEQKTNYANWGSNNFKPATFQRSVLGNALETESSIDYYDALGNVLQYTDKAGITTAIIWGYNNTYPVAKVVGATYSQCKAELSMDTSSLQSLTGNALLTELNRIRTNISAAHVTTYTYKHLVGVTSITDLNNRKNVYYYDIFNRLQLIRDQDSNIVKKVAYSYATPDTTASFRIHRSQALVQTLYVQGCQNGYVASGITFTIPEGAFFSIKSQSAADALAQASQSAHAQNYVNLVGTCDNTLTCTGVDRKVIDCMCVIGWKTYIDTYQNANGTWTCIYKYYFPDNTWSAQQYSEINSSPCGAVE